MWETNSFKKTGYLRSVAKPVGLEDKNEIGARGIILRRRYDGAICATMGFRLVWAEPKQVKLHWDEKNHHVVCQIRRLLVSCSSIHRNFSPIFFFIWRKGLSLTTGHGALGRWGHRDRSPAPKTQSDINLKARACLKSQSSRRGRGGSIHWDR